MIKANSILKILLVSFVAFVMLFSSFGQIAQAGTAWAPGKPPTSGGVAKWPWVAGDRWNENPNSYTDAWKQFVNAHVGRSDGMFPSGASLNKFVSGLKGKTNFIDPNTGAKMTFLESCQRSQYIWWYGTAENGKTWWYTKAGKNDTYPPTGMDQDMKQAWQDYLDTPGNKWGSSRGPILVCSGPGGPPKVEKWPIVLKARSGVFEYTGQQHVVTGWDKISGKDLRPGHKYVVSAEGRRTKPGFYEGVVVFKSPKIVDKDGKDVSKSHYNLKTIPGDITINHKPKDRPDEEFYRCVPTGSDTMTAITRNKMNVTPFLDPSGMLSEIDTERDSDGREIMLDDIPNVSDTRSSWNSWKARLAPVSMDKVVELDLGELETDSGYAFTDIFSEYGGILDIALTHERHKADATFCQPQTRTKYWVTTYDSLGYPVGGYYQYTEWKNSGPEIIDTLSLYKTTPLLGAYQVLGMNCNDPTYRAAKASVAVDSAEEQLDHKGRVISGFFKTALTEGSHTFKLGRGGPGSSMSDYTEGPTCQDNDLCTVQPGSPGNDSDNNQVNISGLPLFTEFKDNKYLIGNKENHKDGRLTFFRDFEERTVRMDVWRLRDSNEDQGYISFSGDPALTTAVQIFPGTMKNGKSTAPTPEYEITVIKSAEDAGAGRDYNKFDDGGQINALPGHHNKFIFKSQWASLDDRPYRLGANWIYEISMQKSGVSGLTNTSMDTYKDIFHGIEVACQFLSSTTADQDAVISNAPFVDPYVSDSMLNWNEEDSAKVIFSRGVTDKRD